SERIRAESVLSEAHRLLAELEDQLTEFRETSPVWKFNHARPGERVALGREAFPLLMRALEIRKRTDGAFDPFAKGSFCAPDALRADISDRTVVRPDAGTWLGFGAIGKGYSIDRIRALIEREGFEDYFLSGGGSSILMSG